MKIYLASSWRNAFQEAVLHDLRHAGHKVYDFKHPAPGVTGFGWRQTIDRPIKTGADLLEALRHPRAQEGFGHDFKAMQWAEACVLLLPCGNSAHLEAGWFAGVGKPVAVFCPELREPELMYKCFDDNTQRTPLFEDIGELLQHLHTVEMNLIADRTLQQSVMRANLEEIQRLDLQLAKARAECETLRRELAEQYPVAKAAREIVQYADDHSAPEIHELAETINSLAKQTDDAKLEYLPTRLRGGS